MEMGESGVGVSKKVMDWVYWEVPMRWSIKVLREFSQNSTTSDIPEIEIACSEGVKGSVWWYLEV